MSKEKCKYMRTKRNWTPNDYELSFPHNSIPVNIPLENVPNLSDRINKVMPLSKHVHLVLNEGNKEFNSAISIVSELQLKINKENIRVDII